MTKKTAAYWDTLDNKDQFKGGTNDSFEPTPKRNAAYYMKQAIRYGETDKAIRYMKDYFKEGRHRQWNCDVVSVYES